jgi:hypothetical protein
VLYPPLRSSKLIPKSRRWKNRTFHLLFKPDILTCYEQMRDTNI